MKGLPGLCFFCDVFHVGDDEMGFYIDMGKGEVGQVTVGVFLKGDFPAQGGFPVETFPEVLQYIRPVAQDFARLSPHGALCDTALDLFNGRAEANHDKIIAPAAPGNFTFPEEMLCRFGGRRVPEARIEEILAFGGDDFDSALGGNDSPVLLFGGNPDEGVLRR